MFEAELNHSFVIVYMGMAFAGMGFGAWALWNWYLISQKCRVLKAALEKEKGRRRPGREAAGR